MYFATSLIEIIQHFVHVQNYGKDRQMVKRFDVCELCEKNVLTCRGSGVH